VSEVLPWLGVGALGALGALGRFTVDTAVSARRPSDFPFGTLAVNLSGGGLRLAELGRSPTRGRTA
jgi:fluoride ion exporter CrcB/FEX